MTDDAPPRCPICDAAETRFRWRLTDRYWEQPGEFDLWVCRACGHGFVHPIPADLGDYYEHWYVGEGWDRVRELQAGAGMRFLHQLRLKRLKQYVTLNIRSKVLDVGCGQGIFLEEVRRAFGSSIAGCDTTDRGLVDMSPEPRRAIDFRLGELADVDFPDEDYQMVVALHVLEHVPAASDQLALAWRKVAPGGILAVETPHFNSIVRRIFGRRWSALEVPYHVHQFTQDSMAIALDRAGLPAPTYIRTVPLFPEMTGTVVMLFKRLLVGASLFHKLMRVWFWILMWFTCIPFDIFASLVLTRVRLGGSVLAVVKKPDGAGTDTATGTEDGPRDTEHGSRNTETEHGSRNTEAGHGSRSTITSHEARETITDHDPRDTTTRRCSTGTDMVLRSPAPGKARAKAPRRKAGNRVAMRTFLVSFLATLRLGAKFLKDCLQSNDRPLVRADPACHVESYSPTTIP